ncbi:MAG TPA: hypothetical protein VNU71_14670 [Burkholderiaceae bacterium]|nr:hypothetical protein [Burkholderiaceae bacterium]
MSTELQTEISALRATAAAALASPFLPSSASAAIGQAVNVIALLAVELEQLRADLAKRQAIDLFAPMEAH